jgi:hypothetical protein
MLKFGAERFHSLSVMLGSLKSILEQDKSGTGAFTEERGITSLKAAFSLIKDECEAIGLALSAVSANRGIVLFNKDKVSFKDCDDIINDIEGRIADELQLSLFLHIPNEKARFYHQAEPLFGKEVAAAFPSTADDISEAGKCLATDRGTATVFHLMRVMEAGLKALAKQLGIPYAPSWESYLKQIASQLELDWKDKNGDWKKDEEFYRDAAAHLGSVKVAWRNPTMHIVKQYTPESAEDIYNSVRVFMRHLATKLSEEKPDA